LVEPANQTAAKIITMRKINIIVEIISDQEVFIPSHSLGLYIDWKPSASKMWTGKLLGT